MAKYKAKKDKVLKRWFQSLKRRKERKIKSKAFQKPKKRKKAPGNQPRSSKK